MEIEQRKKQASVCRMFYEKFPAGKRDHVELVTFLMNHPSSRSKIEEWITREETIHQNVQSSSRMRRIDDYDDCPSLSHGQQNLNIGSPTNASAISENSMNKGSFSKSNVKSVKERELGNSYFKTKNLDQSLRHYNQAIRFAKFSKTQHDTVENECFAVALANRSAVYYDMGFQFYDKALKDIDLALEYGYPERLKIKLLLRKASILTKQGKCLAAQACLTFIKSDNSKCSDAHISNNTLEKIVEIEMQIKKLILESTYKASVPDTADKKRSDSFIENSNFESSSDRITINTSDIVGRHVIAISDLQEGEILFKEQPFSSVLLPEFYDSHCHHCHKCLCDEKGAVYFFPCSRCTQVLFCDVLCAAAAEIYHCYECEWLNLMHSVGIAHLAVRIVLVAGTENVLTCVRTHSTLSDLTNLEIFKRGVNNYHRVYSLVDHINDMFAEDLFQYALTASLLTKFLITKTCFLNDLVEKEQMQIGGALLRHICQLICNAHAITDILPEVVSASSVVMDEYQKRIATAIYPAASIMNHSYGKQLIVKAGRAIKKGENVYNCYGPHFRRMPLTERQEILMQQYFFACSCDKCHEELSIGASFSDQFKALKCEECEQPIPLLETAYVSCSNCGLSQNMQAKVDLLTVVCDLQRKGELLLEEGKIMDAQKTLQSCYDLSSKILFKYNSQFGKICDFLARCSVMIGDLVEAKKLLQKSLKYVEVRFGESSVEFTRELQKYQEVCAKCKC